MSGARGNAPDIPDFDEDIPLSCYLPTIPNGDVTPADMRPLDQLELELEEHQPSVVPWPVVVPPFVQARAQIEPRLGPSGQAGLSCLPFVQMANQPGPSGVSAAQPSRTHQARTVRVVSPAPPDEEDLSSSTSPLSDSSDERSGSLIRYYSPRDDEGSTVPFTPTNGPRVFVQTDLSSRGALVNNEEDDSDSNRPPVLFCLEPATHNLRMSFDARDANVHVGYIGRARPTAPVAQLDLRQAVQAPLHEDTEAVHIPQVLQVREIAVRPPRPRAPPPEPMSEDED